MTRSTSANPSPRRTTDAWVDPRVKPTIKAVNWDTLLKIACKHYAAQHASWGDQKSGGYNLVRFLRISDKKKTTVVVRVPLHPEEGLMTRQRLQACGNRIASEVATMQYVEAHTTITVPHVISYSAKVDENVRSPYIMMTKVEGTSLSAFWNDMPNDRRDIVLQQVVDIYLELASHRFDKIGALFKRDGNGKDAWYIKPLSNVIDAGDSPVAHAVSKVTYSSGTDYWIAYANANLRYISEQYFGSENKVHDYAQAWFLRSLIPSLYKSSLDASGFPLLPGDFHSQNILIADAHSKPRITAVIDWEFSATACTSSFAQYPLFIVDHPMWPRSHPLRQRNVRDQAAFNKFMFEAERKKDPTGKHSLSRAFASGLGVYLFEQSIEHPVMSTQTYPQLFAHIFGDDDKFRGDYYWALMEDGVLRKETKQFDNEAKVWNEAKSVLGDKVANKEFTRSEFIDVARKSQNRFSKSGKVLQWLGSL